MNDTMYIPKGQEALYENLTCENIVVDGVLEVAGTLFTKHISGKGFLFAGAIRAESIAVSDIDAADIAANTLLAERVRTVDLHAVQSAAVSCYLEAELVKAGRITLAESNISELIADEIIQLTPKKRSLLGTLWAASLRSKRTRWFHKSPPVDAIVEPVEAAPIVPMQVLTEDEKLLASEDFQRLKAMYHLQQNGGFRWQLMHNEPESPNPFMEDAA